MDNTAIICIPKKDNQKRFLIGKSGYYEMLAIGLNPTTANEDKLDPTSRNIQSIALRNNCDGWWLINISTKRIPKRKLLSRKANLSLHEENLDFIKKNQKFRK